MSADTHSATYVHDQGERPLRAEYFAASHYRPAFVSLAVDGARVDHTVWLDGRQVLQTHATDRTASRVFLSPERARELANSILNELMLVDMASTPEPAESNVEYATRRT